MSHLLHFQIISALFILLFTKKIGSSFLRGRYVHTQSHAAGVKNVEL